MISSSSSSSRCSFGLAETVSHLETSGWVKKAKASRQLLWMAIAEFKESLGRDASPEAVDCISGPMRQQGKRHVVKLRST